MQPFGTQFNDLPLDAITGGLMDNLELYLGWVFPARLPVLCQQSWPALVLRPACLPFL